MTTLTVSAGDLKAATAWVARALPNRPTAPVLSAMVLTTEAGVLTLSAFDYTLHAAVTIPADGDIPGPVLLPGQMLTSVAARLTGQATITVDSRGVTIVAGRSRFELRPMLGDDYPTLPTPVDPVATVDASTFTEALTAVEAATAREDGALNLTGVKLAAADGELTMYATDRYRLVAATIPWDGPALDVVLPGGPLVDAVKGMTGTLRIGSDGDRLTAATNSHRFTLGAKAGEYPAGVARLMQQPAPTFEAVAGKAGLLDALADARLGIDQKAPVHLTFHGGEVTVEATKAGGEFWVAAKAPVDMEGGQFVFRCNPDFLTDQVRHAPADRVHLAFVDPGKPVTIIPADDTDPAYGYTAVVMPLKGNQP